MPNSFVYIGSNEPLTVDLINLEPMFQCSFIRTKCCTRFIGGLKQKNLKRDLWICPRIKKPVEFAELSSAATRDPIGLMEMLQLNLRKLISMKECLNHNYSSSIYNHRINVTHNTRYSNYYYITVLISLYTASNKKF